MDEPEHHEVGGDAQEHVDELEAQVPDEDARHVSAALVHRHLPGGVVQWPVGDQQGRGVHTEKVHDAASQQRRRTRDGIRESKTCLKRGKTKLRMRNEGRISTKKVVLQRTGIRRRSETTNDNKTTLNTDFRLRTQQRKRNFFSTDKFPRKLRD